MSIEPEGIQKERREIARLLLHASAKRLVDFYSNYRPEATLSKDMLIIQARTGIQALLTSNFMSEIYKAIDANQDKSINLEMYSRMPFSILQLQEAEQPFLSKRAFATQVYYPAVEAALSDVVGSLGIPFSRPTRQFVEQIPGVDQISSNTFAAKATVEGLENIRLIYRYPPRRKRHTHPTISLEIRRI